MLRDMVILCLISFNALASEIRVTPIHSVSQLPNIAPIEGHYRLHLIDVGTGLSILIQGHDWNLLYDAGSGDDKAGNQLNGNSNSRIIAYLYKAIGSSGSKNCVPAEDEWDDDTSVTQRNIDYIFLSHPHEDHGVMLDDVLECYEADFIYDSGRVNDTLFYRRFLERVADESGVIYRTAKKPASNKSVTVYKKKIDLRNTTWEQFHELDKVELDKKASFTILHADGSSAEEDPNSNSIVVRLDLGDKSVLLTGDAESGPRRSPSAPLDGVEKKLYENYEQLLDTDILQVGHHGSLTSSRTEFIKAVSPEIGLISAGPKKYKTVVLPDEEVVESLKFEGIHVLRTDNYDNQTCPVEEKIGRNDDRAGGCSSFMLEW